MRLPSGKRYLVVEKDKDQENSPPNLQSKSKRSRLKTPTEDNESVLTPPILTPPPSASTGTEKERSILSPRSSLSNITTPTISRSALQRRPIPPRRQFSSVDFHGIPTSPLETLLVSDPKLSPCESVFSKRSVSSYFSHRKRRGKRSGRRFHDLQLSRLSLESFQKKQPESKPLDEDYSETVYKQWKLETQIGKNILVYGFGSKLEFIEKFGLSRHCEDGVVLSVYGFKDITIREILLQSAKLLLSKDFKKESSNDIIAQIKDSKEKLYLLVHNIDAPSLRKSQDQSILAKLAACENVVMVSSMENVNGCRLWDTQTFSCFDWSMFAVHTCSSYAKEAADRPLVLNPKTNGRREDGDPVRAALLVLRSLVQNAQQIFLLLAQHKIAAKTSKESREDPAQEESLGCTFDGLFQQCKEKFLASQASTLRSHLKEFACHDLVFVQRNDLGIEEYVVQLEVHELEKVVEEMKKGQKKN